MRNAIESEFSVLCLVFFASGRNFFNCGWGAHQILSTWQGSKIHSCGHSDLKIDLCKCHCERHWVSWKLIEHVFVWKPRWQDVSKVRPARFSNTHRTNVWYVYLHLLQTSTKRGKIYHTPILCDMASWKKNSGFCPEWLERSWKIHPRKLTWIPKIAIFSKRDTFSKPSFLVSMLDFKWGTPRNGPTPFTLPTGHRFVQTKIMLSRMPSRQKAIKASFRWWKLRMSPTIKKINSQIGGFLKWWYPTTMGFPTKMIIKC